MKIKVKNGVVEFFINGVLQNKATSDVKNGYIGLQSEGKEIQFQESLREKFNVANLIV